MTVQPPSRGPGVDGDLEPRLGTAGRPLLRPLEPQSGQRAAFVAVSWGGYVPTS